MQLTNSNENERGSFITIQPPQAAGGHLINNKYY